MKILCAVIALTVSLSVPAQLAAQQTNPNNRKELERIGLGLTGVGLVMIGAAALRGDWETRLCPQAGQSWRDVTYDRDFCATLRNEQLDHLKAKPDWTLTAMGSAATTIGVFTYFLARRYSKAPDVSIRITPTGAMVSHTISF